MESEASGTDHYYYNYSLKIVNPLKMKEFRNIDLGNGKVFQLIKCLQQFISETIPDSPNIVKPELEN